MTPIEEVDAKISDSCEETKISSVVHSGVNEKVGSMFILSNERQNMIVMIRSVAVDFARHEKRLYVTIFNQLDKEGRVDLLSPGIPHLIRGGIRELGVPTATIFEMLEVSNARDIINRTTRLPFRGETMKVSKDGRNYWDSEMNVPKYNGLVLLHTTPREDFESNLISIGACLPWQARYRGFNGTDIFTNEIADYDPVIINGIEL